MKRSRFKSNKALTFVLCGIVLICSIGLALAAHLDKLPYSCQDLTLIQGQNVGDGDLMEGITYDKDKFALSVTDKGGFDVNQLGDYEITYQLTSVEPLPSAPEPPAGSDSGPSTEPGIPGSGSDSSTKPGVSGSGSGTSTTPETSGSGSDTSTTPGSSGPSTSTKPGTSGSGSGTSTTPETSGSGSDTSTTPGSSGPSTSTKPGTSGSGSGASTTPETSGSGSDTSTTPETSGFGSGPSTTPGTSDSGSDTSTPETSGSGSDTSAKPESPAAKPESPAVKPESPSETKSDSPSDGQVGSAVSNKTSGGMAAALPKENGEALSSPKRLIGASVYGLGWEAFAPPQVQYSRSADTAAPEMEGASQPAQWAASQIALATSTGNPSGSASGSDSAAGNPSGSVSGSDSAAGDPSGSASVSDSAVSDPSGSASGSDSAVSDPSGSVSGSGTSSPAQDHSVPPGQISFTRMVHVVPVDQAITYQNLRLDAGDSKSDLMTGMKIQDPSRYSVKVKKDADGSDMDGMFSISRINEYKVTYELTDETGDRHIADLERYVWVTAPGVKGVLGDTFDVPPVKVDPPTDNPSKEETSKYLAAVKTQLFSDIPYDKNLYDLELVDKNRPIDPQKPFQRVMLRLTLKSSSKTSPETADASSGGAGDGSELSDLSGASSPDGTPGSNQQILPLEAAVFGRDVTLNGKEFVKWDAPPLVITQGAIQNVNLLDGVTVTDEKGDVLKPYVVDRSELDAGRAEGDASPSGIDGQNLLTAASRSDGSSSQDEYPMIVMPNRTSNNALGSGRDGKENASNNALGSGRDGKENVSNNALGSGRDDKEDTADNALASGADTKDQTANNALVSSGDNSVQTVSGVTESELIQMAKNESVPAELVPPGLNYIMLAVSYPETEKISVCPRAVVSNTIFPVSLSAPQAAGGVYNKGYNTLSDLFIDLQNQYNAKKLDQGAGGAVEYTVQIGPAAGELTEYICTESDRDELKKLNIKSPNVTIVLTGKNSSQSSANTLFIQDLTTGLTKLSFPRVDDSSQWAAFQMKDISIKYTIKENKQELYIQAKGSKLTIGPNLSLDSVGVNVGYILIGGTMDAPDLDPIHTDLTIYGTLRNQFNRVYGGNYSQDTNGSTRVTADGLKLARRGSLYGGGGTDLTTTTQCDQYGDSTVMIRGDSQIDSVYCGAQGKQNSAKDTPDIPCTTKLTIQDGKISMAYGSGKGFQKGNSEVRIEGGNIESLIGGNDIEGTVAIDMSGGTVGGMVGTASVMQTHRAKIHIKLTGGSITYQLVGGWGLEDDPWIEVAGPCNIEAINFFNQLTVAAGLKLSTHSLWASDNMDTIKGIFGEQTRSAQDFKGRVILGAGSTLSVNAQGWQGLKQDQNIGSLSTLGAGATLEVLRGNPLRVTTSKLSDMTDLEKYPLKLKFIDSSGTAGDSVLSFERSHPSAESNPNTEVRDATIGNPALAYHTEWYVPEFPNELSLQGIQVFSDTKKTNVGLIRLLGSVGIQDDSDTSHTVNYYGDVATAMEKGIGGKTGKYTLTIRNEGYQFSALDGAALIKYGHNASQITYTSRIQLTDKDPIQASESVGDWVIRSVNVGDHPSLAALPSGVHPDISFPCDTVINQIQLNYTARDCAIFANGHSFTAGKNVNVFSSGENYPSLYGGADKTDVNSTNMKISGGKFDAIYGGGRTGNVTGNVSVTVDGGELHGPFYGGGKDGTVGGTVTTNISGGTLTLATFDPTHGFVGENTVIAGGESGAVAGLCSMTISGGTARGRTTVAGCDKGTAGSVKLDIEKIGLNGETRVPAANIYGGGLRGGKVAGSAMVQINAGKDYVVVSGGGNPAYDWTTPGSLAPSAYQSVAGAKSVYFYGTAVEIQDIENFDVCQVGSTGEKTTLSVGGNLDSNGDKGNDYSARTGKLSLYGGSVVNLNGSQIASPKTLAVGSLFTQEGGSTGAKVPSHLHIVKEGTTTFPLHVAGQNSSNPSEQIQLGILMKGSTSANSGTSGDVLLSFSNAANAKPEQYLPDSATLVIAADVSTKKDIIYTGRGYPTAQMTDVSQDKPEDLYNGTPGSSVIRTLTFELKANLQTGTYSGQLLDHCYIDKLPGVEQAWIDDGTVPLNALPIELSTVGGAPSAAGWIGKAAVETSTRDQPVEYFAHIRANDKNYTTIALDLNPPVKIDSYQLTLNENGEYEIGFTVKEHVFPPTQEIGYTAAGLYQWGWCAGPLAGGPSQEVLTEATKHTMTNAAVISDITTVPSGDMWSEYPVKFKVKKADLGEDLQSMAVYVFVKDLSGNTTQMTIPMSSSQIDVTVPSQVGIIALRGAKPQLLAPVCYLKNGGPGAVEAEIVGIQQISAASGPAIKFVDKAGSFASDEMNLWIMDPPGSGSAGGTFTRSIMSGISPLSPISLGDMAAKSDTQGMESYVDFGFKASYNSIHIPLTNDWSAFTISYRFIAKPSAPAPKV